MNTVTDVIEAIRKGDLTLLKQLLAESRDLVNARDENGNSPLLMSIYFGRKEFTRFILDQGVQPSFFEACAAGVVDAVQRMLREQPRLIREKSHDGWTALHLASFFGHVELAQILLDTGADMLAVSNNDEHNLAINAAGAGKHGTIVRMLVERGCPVDARGSDKGYTALHLAAHEGNPDLVRFLLKAGANRKLKTGDGDTAYDLARRRGHGKEILDALQQGV